MGSNTNSVSSSRSALPKLNSLEKSIQQPVFITSDYMKEEVKLEKKVDQILQNLRRSQEVEYKMAKDKLYAQKDFIVGLYQQLDAKRSELARSVSATVSCDVDELLTNVSNRVDQIRQEDSRLNVMAEVGKGFGRTPRDILEDYFDLHIED
ncbi:hypothetical protein GIB67_020387 [Kingdonia uniflora]|uniref:DUF7615 domain-containing protein n=1 Tax=Kingdonia uniflora TaxID=39325 RepID=A0A7J7LBF4_9MAGN|nr:hypothetical protein GIB67_020387 [Kingdonia uniflora]